MKVKSAPTEMAEKLQFTERLDAMNIVPCEEFVKALNVSLLSPLSSPSLLRDLESRSLFSLRRRSERRTTTPRRTLPLDRWTTFGMDPTTLLRSIPCSGVGTSSRLSLSIFHFRGGEEVDFGWISLELVFFCG